MREVQRDKTICLRCQLEKLHGIVWLTTTLFSQQLATQINGRNLRQTTRKGAEFWEKGLFNVQYLNETNGFASLFKHLAHDFIMRHYKSTGKSTHRNCQPLLIVSKFLINKKSNVSKAKKNLYFKLHIFKSYMMLVWTASEISNLTAMQLKRIYCYRSWFGLRICYHFHKRIWRFELTATYHIL